jgi:hypothetical protein
MPKGVGYNSSPNKLKKRDQLVPGKGSDSPPSTKQGKPRNEAAHSVVKALSRMTGRGDKDITEVSRKSRQKEGDAKNAERLKSRSLATRSKKHKKGKK